MYAQLAKSKEGKSKAVANSVTQKKGNKKPSFNFIDNRSEAKKTAQLQAMMYYREESHQNQDTIQRMIGLGDLFGLDQWQPTGGNPTRQNFEALRNNGHINANALMQVIPAGLENQFDIEPRTQRGFKFEWGNWHVHGHEPDAGAQAGHVGAAGWIVKIKDGNEWLLSQTWNSNFPSNHQNYTPPREWGSGNSQFVRTHSHIPLDV